MLTAGGMCPPCHYFDMGDLFVDDIEDKAYSDKTVLDDIRTLVIAEQREGTVLDYKSDISDKDTWPASVAAFANSFGGLIIFGVEGHNDQPRRLTGFDPKGIETKTKLTSMVLDRIQPRPDFSVRVVRFDQDPTKEIALLRVAEGSHPPYMHSKDKVHRIFIRVGAQKTEPDYLQLSSLLEKRAKAGSQNVAAANEMIGADSFLHVNEPQGTNQVSPNFLRFVLSPRITGPDLRLSFATERLLWRCIRDVSQSPQREEPLLIRSKAVTIFRVSNQLFGEQRFGLAKKGGLGFVSFPGIRTSDGVCLDEMEYCRFLVEFLCVGSLFYQRAVRFYGSCVLEVNLNTTPAGVKLSHKGIFHPPLEVLAVNGGTEIEVAMSPITHDRLQDCVEAVLTDLARIGGNILRPDFRELSVKGLVDGVLSRLNAARGID